MVLYNLSAEAFLKILLHGIKYPHASLNGILVGSVDNDGADVVVRVKDAIPLQVCQFVIISLPSFIPIRDVECILNEVVFIARNMWHKSRLSAASFPHSTSVAAP